MGYKVLFITRHYLDDNNGGANGSKGFIYTFANVYENMDLIYPEHDNVNSSIYAPQKCTCYPCYDHRSKIQKVFDMYRGRLHRFTCFVNEHLSVHHYNIIVIDHSLTAASLIDTIYRTNAKIITIHHNVERDYIKDNEPSIFYRIPYDYFCKKAERDCLLCSDLNLTVTERDASEFRTWCQNKNINIFNLGNCEYRPIPLKSFANSHNNHTFVITGSLCFEQSVRPVIDFLENYYPIIKAVCASCKLIIAGRNPSQRLQNICHAYNDVEIIPNPEDMAAIVKEADYYICPINTGSGFKLRALDGLKEGLPVICHDVSASGYEDIEKKECLFTYNDKESFTDSLKQMINSKKNHDDVYNAYKDRFSLEAGTERLRMILKKNELLKTIEYDNT